MKNLKLSDRKICSVCKGPLGIVFTELKIPKNKFKGWEHKILNGKTIKTDRKIKTKVLFMNAFWKVIAYTKPQRSIIYWVWSMFKGREKVSYYECSKCM